VFLIAKLVMKQLTELSDGKVKIETTVETKIKVTIMQLNYRSQSFTGLGTFWLIVKLSPHLS
jgi:hypothetical protein